MKARGKGGGEGFLARTVHDYTAASTIHGLSYLFDRRLPLAERLCWSLVVASLLTIAGWLGAESVQEYQAHRALTTLAGTNKPVTELAFPAVTICSQGLSMDRVAGALQRDFEQWSLKQESKEFDEFLTAKFSMDPAEQYSLLDVLQSLASPNPEASVGPNGARENLLACAGTGPEVTTEKTKIRKKRNDNICKEQGGYYPHPTDCRK
jgi:hypothetical protein